MMVFSFVQMVTQRPCATRETEGGRRRGRVEIIHWAYGTREVGVKEERWFRKITAWEGLVWTRCNTGRMESGKR